MKLIATALVKAQKSFGPALKSATNPHFRSKYADLASCVDAVVDALNDNGIFLFQTTAEHSDGIICETSFLHESGERLDCGKLFFPSPKNDPQGFMSCLTYIRRASLLAACGLAPEDDDGNAASKSTVNASALADYILAIENSVNGEELVKIYADAYAACGNDQKWQAKVIAAKKARIEKAKKEKETT
jgi:hypothetical protein